MESGYAICLNKWTLDDDIKNELRILLIISSLCAKKGYCYATNEYFSKLFNATDETISRKIKKLEEKKYIKITYIKKGALINSREIRLTKISTAIDKNINGTIDENVKENNINISKNINYKNIKEKGCSFYQNKKLDDIFKEYLELRTKLKCKNTERAIQLLINKLDNYDDDTKIEMLEQSIMNSWKSVYEIKNKKKLPKWFNKQNEIEQGENLEDKFNEILEGINEN